MVPPQERYILDSARVEKAGPSITTIVPVLCSRKCGSAAWARSDESSGQKGSANAMCPTGPASKNVLGRPRVLSIIWSGTTASLGSTPSARPPTAFTDTIRSTPRIFSAYMLARDGRLVGRWTCPLPCLGRNATGLPASLPTTIASLGSPYGVSTRTSRACSRPSISYRPVPPMNAAVASATVGQPPGPAMQTNQRDLSSPWTRAASASISAMTRPVPFTGPSARSPAASMRLTASASSRSSGAASRTARAA